MRNIHGADIFILGLDILCIESKRAIAMITLIIFFFLFSL